MLSEEEKQAMEFFKECIIKDHLFEEDFTLYNMKIFLNLITKLQKENEEKDKQIDLMAEEINETDRGYTDYCEMKIECDRNCKDCIKRYYERKSEEWKLK